MPLATIRTRGLALPYHKGLYLPLTPQIHGYGASSIPRAHCIIGTLWPIIVCLPPSDNTDTMSQPSQGPLKQFIWHTLGVAVATIPSVWLAHWLDTLNQRRLQAYQDAKEKREDKALLQRLHADYSPAMAFLFQFKRNHPDYAKVFVDNYQAPNATEELKNVNRCRSLTKDYWRMIRSYCETRGCDASTDITVREWKHQHARFVTVVQPIDHLEGYDDGEKELYEWAHISSAR